MLGIPFLVETVVLVGTGRVTINPICESWFGLVQLEHELLFARLLCVFT